MRNVHYANVLLTGCVIAAIGAAACSSSSEANNGVSTSADEAEAEQSEEALARGQLWWKGERAARERKLDGYVAANAADFASYKNAPLGNSGIPMVMFRVFAEIMPDIWGAPDTFMAPIGFAQDPYEPTRVLPLGMGEIASSTVIPVPVPAADGSVSQVPVAIHVAGLTCMGCHGGRVAMPDGATKTMIGAPNTQFNQLRGAVFRTVNDPRYTAQAFRDALNAKPLGFVYGDPALAVQEQMERGIFNSPNVAEGFLAKLKASANGGAARWAATLGAYTYQVPNAPNPSAPQPGFLDAIGAGIAVVVDPAALTPDQVRAAVPPAPAFIDIMSVWNQKDRASAQWDGSIASKLHRNLAAEFGVVGNPQALNMDNANRTTQFTENLPSAPYPFDVDAASAYRGRELYGKYCKSCHSADNATIFSPAEIGTDPNRANIWTDYSLAGITQMLRIGCTDQVTCNQPDGTPIPDSQIARKTGGYMAVPLDGIWARAPYLHNGSVPTIAALLTGDRPAQFWRGNVAYDEANVGFVTTSGTGQFDTSKSGNANTGHSTAEFNGRIDWKKDKKKLKDLLSYLKTL